MKKIAFFVFVLIILITCLSSCKHLSSNSSAAPAEVASVNAGENETTHNLTDKAETFPTIREETLAYENTEDEPMRLISEVNGRIIQTKIDCKNGKSILVDAVVDTTNISSVNCYSYSICPLTDHIRDSILNAYLGDRFSEVEYDERNDMWILKNSDQVGDYYRYTTSYGWDGLPEEMFNLEYRNVNLYPFEDNLLSSVEDVSMNLSLEDALSLCNHMIEALPNSGRYTVDYVLPFGNNGRSQYYIFVDQRYILSLINRVFCLFFISLYYVFCFSVMCIYYVSAFKFSIRNRFMFASLFIYYKISSIDWIFSNNIGAHRWLYIWHNNRCKVWQTDRRDRRSAGRSHCKAA